MLRYMSSSSSSRKRKSYSGNEEGYSPIHRIPLLPGTSSSGSVASPSPVRRSRPDASSLAITAYFSPRRDLTATNRTSGTPQQTVIPSTQPALRLHGTLPITSAVLQETVQTESSFRSDVDTSSSAEDIPSSPPYPQPTAESGPQPELRDSQTSKRRDLQWDHELRLRSFAGSNTSIPPDTSTVAEASRQHATLVSVSPILANSLDIASPQERQMDEIHYTDSPHAFDEPHLEELLDSLATSDDDHGSDAGSITPVELENDTNQEDTELNQAADVVLHVLRMQAIGCGVIKHQEALSQHEAELDGGTCHDLSVTYDDDVSYLRGGISTAITTGLRNLQFPKPLDIARGNIVRSSTIRDVIEGCHTDDVHPRNVCLHQEFRPVTQPRLEYDTDGVIIYSEDLRPFKKDIQTVFSKITTHNVDSDLHFTTKVRRYDKRGRIKEVMANIRDLPQLYIGTVPEFNNSALFRVFPLLQTATGSTWLTDHDAQRYLTEVWIKSCRWASTDGVRQYIPPDSQVAEQKASAQAKEHMSGSEARARVIKTYPLRGSDLWAIEDYAESIINDPTRGLADFQHSFVFMDAKNTKLNLRDQHIWQTLERFQALIDANLDEDQATVISDLAVECIPGSSTNIDTDDDTSDPPHTSSHVYLWKACCLKTLVDELRTKLFPGQVGRIQTFHNVYLRDSTCITVTPPAKSLARRAGLLYAQAYVVEKAFEDANAVRPFDRTQIVNLAIADDLYRSQSFPLSRTTLERNYIACKKRLATTFDSYRGSSTGGRFEVRLRQPLRRRIHERAWKEVHPLGQNPDFFWVLPTSTWLAFKRGNFEKITSLIDVIILFNPTTGVTNRSAQVLFLLLHYLQNLSNCNLRRKSLLSKSVVTVNEVQKYGLGLEANLQRHGFGWMLPIIDWDRFSPRPELENRIIGVGDVVGVCYRDQEALRLAYDHKSLMEVCYEALRASTPGSAGEFVILSTMASFVLRTYRRDVWDVLSPPTKEVKNEVRAAFRSQQAKDQTHLCFDALAEALAQPPLLVTGNRAGIGFGPDLLFRWVMTNDPIDRKRTHLDGKPGSHSRKPYRTSLYQIWQVTEQTPGLTARWNHALREVCKRYLWLFPMPDGNGGLIACQQKRHKFVSVMVDGKGEWHWGRADTRHGRPPAWPLTLDLSPEELTQYLSQAQNLHAGQHSKHEVRAIGPG